MDRAREIVTGLKKAYAMALESMQNYLANSVHLEGPLAEEVHEFMDHAGSRELRHARRLAKRIKILDNRVPGSLELARDQSYLQPPADNRDLHTVIRGALTATDTAITHYQEMVRMTESLDYVTQDLLIELLTEKREQKKAFQQLLARLPTGAR
jgi:bacterioferritin